jgi:hypothetical protein|nr:hypothetical protein [uncultured Pseudoxanthomonas sp.]
MTPETLHARLAALPEPELPPTLWPRVQRARTRQRERHRRLAVGAVAVLALAALPLVYTHLLPPAAPVSERFTVVPRAPLHEEPLRAVDRELQHAYERGASEQELQWLWQRREALARTSAAPSLPQPVEI